MVWLDCSCILLSRVKTLTGMQIECMMAETWKGKGYLTSSQPSFRSYLVVRTSRSFFLTPPWFSPPWLFSLSCFSYPEASGVITLSHQTGRDLCWSARYKACSTAALRTVALSHEPCRDVCWSTRHEAYSDVVKGGGKSHKWEFKKAEEDVQFKAKTAETFESFLSP